VGEKMSRSKLLIIVVLLSLLGPVLTGCSAIRLAYANGPQLSWWWLDSYLDFSRDQSPVVRTALDRWFDWHRASQLPEYAVLLAQAQAQVLDNSSPAHACAWNSRVRDRIEPALQRTALDFAELVHGLGEPQFKQLEQRYAKGNEDLKNDFMQPDPAIRLRESIKRTLDRAERVYGSLDEPQKKVIAAGMAASPFNPELWLAERLRRQRDTVQTLRRLQADKADREQRQAALRALLQRTEQSPDPAYRAYQVKLVDFNCALVAQVHNATTPAQRQKARQTLKGWEEDLRAIGNQVVNSANSPTVQ
jgi:Family of unknown function (DUF6279)